MAGCTYLTVFSSSLFSEDWLASVMLFSFLEKAVFLTIAVKEDMFEFKIQEDDQQHSFEMV